MNDLIKAVGIETLPAGESEISLTQKILTDARVFERTLARLVEIHAAAVIGAMPELERAALRRKLCPPLKPEQKTVWGFHISPTNGDPSLMASCAVCHRTNYFPAPLQTATSGYVTFDVIENTLANVKMQHCGRTEFPPKEVLDDAKARYCAMYNL